MTSTRREREDSRRRSGRRRRKRVKINYTRLLISAIIVLVVLFLLIRGVSALIGGGDKPKSPTTEKDTKSTSESKETSSSETEKINSESEELLPLTAEQKAADIQFVKDLINKSHPYFPILIEDKKVDWETVTKTYEEKALAAANDSEYSRIMSEWIRQLGDPQTNLLSYDYYQYLHKKYQESSKQPWLEVLQAPQVKKRYESMQSEEIDNAQPDENAVSAPGTITMEKAVEGQLAYVRIPQFTEAHIAEDAAVIRSFLESLQDYPHLVFDLRGNNEGVNMYWIKNIVSPLISLDHMLTGRIALRDQSFQAFMDDSLKNKNNYIKFGDFFPINELPSELSVPTVIKESFEGYRRFDLTVIPDSPIAYEGTIYILQDKDTYGAADTLAQFAKSTGFATVIGTTSRGFGMTAELEPALLSLPNSGLVLRMPFTVGLDYNGAITTQLGTTPDIEINKEILSPSELIDFLR